ncbi:hypothetical protein MATL_G00054900 [Megalops atlanticus]|uniref:C2H2-type domain-containing protein n=1 Tax=Megalops atlanticus TaxID=7932 RepID=A0A9D3QEP0_MEGAT|nr:hypothetical protein MATL_G00054900 [Megalops atlanticus]
MHETLRENKSLKQRLQAAELEVCALRGRVDDESKVQPVAPDLGGESTSRTESQELTVTEGSCHNVFPASRVEMVQFDHAAPAACSETTPGVDTPRTLVENQTLPVSVCQKSEAEQPLEVKEESPDLACASGSVSFVGGEEDIGPDSLSLAQSKLLEDWKPEPLHLQSGDTDCLIPCTSHSMPDSAVFNPEIPDVLAPAASGLPLPFSEPYSPEQTAGISISGQPFSAQMTTSNTKMPSGAHVCKICGEVFHLAGELRRHRSQHHSPTASRNPKRQVFPPGRSPYHCSLCGRDFNRMEHLKIHQRIHTGERPYACSVCNTRFRHSWALTRHFRIHTGEKPYVCNQCGKTFRNCGGLRFHQRSHSMGGAV